MPFTSSPADLSEPVTTALNVVLEFQAMENWCWAAVTAASANFQRSVSTNSQFTVAAKVLGDASCGQQSPPATCDLCREVRGALATLGVTFTRKSGSISWNELVTAIDANALAVARIGWSTTGSGHFVLLAGYEAAQQRVVVLDSELGADLVSFKTFPADFRAGTSWTHTYLVSK